jgi:hypothetical protein
MSLWSWLFGLWTKTKPVIDPPSHHAFDRVEEGPVQPSPPAPTPATDRPEPAASSAFDAHKTEAEIQLPSDLPPIRRSWVAPNYLIPKLPPFGVHPVSAGQHEALRSVGFDADGWTSEQARLVLSARDYFAEIISRHGAPQENYKLVRLWMINRMMQHPEHFDALVHWSEREWKRRSGQVRLTKGPMHATAIGIWQNAMNDPKRLLRP